MCEHSPHESKGGHCASSAPHTCTYLYFHCTLITTDCRSSFPAKTREAIIMIPPTICPVVVEQEDTLSVGKLLWRSS